METINITIKASKEDTEKLFDFVYNQKPSYRFLALVDYLRNFPFETEMELNYD